MASVVTGTKRKKKIFLNKVIRIATFSRERRRKSRTPPIDPQKDEQARSKHDRNLDWG